MSYVLTAYRLDIARLKSVIGSKDPSILDDVMANIPEEFEFDDEDDEEDELTLSAALRHLIMDEEMDAAEAHQYGYALQEICDYLGERLECDCWNGVRWSAVEQCGLDELLSKTGPPIAIPPNSDFPRIGHIQRAKTTEYLDAARTRARNSQGGDIQSLLNEYIGWLEASDEQRSDILFFYH